MGFSEVRARKVAPRGVAGAAFAGRSEGGFFGGIGGRLRFALLGGGRFGLGQSGEGLSGGGAGELHAEIDQLRQHSQVVCGALGCFVRLVGRGGVQSGWLLG